MIFENAVRARLLAVRRAKLLPIVKRNYFDAEQSVVVLRYYRVWKRTLMIIKK
jgi:hypothetical protein